MTDNSDAPFQLKQSGGRISLERPRLAIVWAEEQLPVPCADQHLFARQQDNCRDQIRQVCVTFPGLAAVERPPQ
jgi:hypothetical protein